MAQNEKIYAVSFKGIEKIKTILEGSPSDIKRLYTCKTPFLKSEDFVDTGISCHLPNLVFTNKKSKAKDDEKNTILLHSALKSLSRRQAASLSLWLWFTHFRYWDYMQMRWHGAKDKNGEKLRDYIKTHHFLFSSSSRAYFRNGISRLWWYGEISYEDKNQYLNTSLMLEKLDITSTLVERTIGRVPAAMEAVFAILAKKKKHFESGNNNSGRTRFRKLIKNLGWHGTKELLDVKTKDEIESLLDACTSRK
jgi:hypothetical protein